MKNTSRCGTTLIELLAALAVVTALALIALPPAAALRDRAAVRSAATELRSALSLARSAALAEMRVVAVRLDTAVGSAWVVTPADTLLELPLGARYGITLHATRDSVAYGPTGRGYGAANTTILLRRGRAADTLTISRLGRVRT